MSWSFRNCVTISLPKTKLTPLSFSLHPDIPFSGSDQSRSQRRPWSGTSTGLTILRIWSKFSNWGLIPPCMQRIFSSMRAHTGITLKTSEKTFHSFRLYFLLPLLDMKYIHHRNHKYDWYWSIHDFLWVRKSFQGILFCTPTIKRCTLSIVFLCRCNHPRTGSLCLRGNLHTQIAWSDLRTDHGYPHKSLWVPRAKEA